MSFHTNVMPKRFGVGASRGATMTFCPDCGEEIPSDVFVAHREQEHPPAPIVVSGIGNIKSQAKMGYDPPDPEG